MSNYSDIRKRLEAERAVRDAAIELAVAFDAAKGTKKQREEAAEVVTAKARLLRVLTERDNDLSAAVEKALAPLGVQRTAAWLFADGVPKPDSAERRRM